MVDNARSAKGTLQVVGLWLCSLYYHLWKTTWHFFFQLRNRVYTKGSE
jgi:hypothetical protein